MTFNAKITDKSSHQSQASNQADIRLPAPSVVTLQLARAAVERIERQGDALVLITRRGERLVVHGFFAAPEGRDSTLVLEDDSRLFEIQWTSATPTPFEISDIEPLLDDRGAWGILLPLAAGVAAILADGGHAAAASAPAAPTLSLTPQTDGTVTASGVATAGAQVRVLFPDGTSMTVTADPQGHYSATSTAAQPSGEVSATALNSQGQSSDATALAFIDVTPAATPSASQLAAAADGTLVVGGVAEPGSTVTVTFPDGSTATTTAGRDGSFSVQSSSPQTSGDVQIASKDAAGNASSIATQPYTDTSPPAAPTSTLSANPDGSVTVSGKAEPGSTVSLTYPDGSTGSATAGPDGSYTATSPANQPSGPVSAKATDAAGNAGANTTTPYVDATPPAAPTVLPSNNADGSVTVSGSAERGATVKVTFPDGSTGSTTAGPDGSYTLTSPVNQPSGTVSATATDAAGNTGSAATAGFKDTTPPDAPTLDVTTQADGAIAVSGTAEPGATVKVTFPDGSTGSTTAGPDGSYTLTSPVNQPSGTVSATATDAAGLTGPKASAPFADSTPPAAPTTTLSNNADGSVTVSGVAEPGSIVAITYPDGSPGSATAGLDGSYTLTSPVNQPSGTVSVTATDAAGNTGSAATPSFTDTTPPAAPSVQLTTNPNGSVSVQGVAEPGSTVKLTFPDGSTATVTANDSGGYSATSPINQPSGEVKAVATDAANNTGAVGSATFTDTTAPLTTASITAATDHQTPQLAELTSGASTNDLAPTLKGTISAALATGETLQVLRDGSVIGTALVSGKDWTFNESGLVNGSTHTYTVRVMDQASNTGTPSDGFSLTVDTAVPTALATVVSYTDDVVNQTGTFLTGTSTNDTAPVINGTLSAPLTTGEVVNVYRGGVLQGTAVVNGTSWTLAQTGLLNDNSYSYTAQVVDAAGNVSDASSALTLNVDTSPPTGTIVLDVVTPSDSGTNTTDNITNVASPTITGSITGMSATDISQATAGTLTATVFVDANGNGTLDAGEQTLASGLSITGSGSTFTTTLPALYDGSYQLQAVMVDAATGNTSTANPSGGVALTVATEVAGTVAANASNAAVIVGSVSNGALGYDVSSAGDFNGDGIADLIVSAPHQFSGGSAPSGSSEIYVVYGTRSGIPSASDVSTLSSSQALRITNVGNTLDSAVTGHVATSAGDLNGDGFGDVVIASISNHSAYVVWGRAAATASFSLNSMDITSTNDGFRIADLHGTTAYDPNGTGGYFGASAGGGFDYNGDGYADLLVSSPQGPTASGYPAGLESNGIYYVLYGHAGTGAAAWADIVAQSGGLYTSTGSTSATLAAGTLMDASTYSLVGSSNSATYGIGNFTGSTTQDVGDVNGDGFHDYVVTAPLANVGSVTDAGVAYLIYGQLGGLGTTFDLKGLTSSQGIALTGSEQSEELGSSPYGPGNNKRGDTTARESNTVNTVGDINGDGIADFAVGSPEWGDAASDGFAPGRVYVMYGKASGGWTSGAIATAASGADGFTLTSSGSTDAALGNSIRSVGDTNGDGIDDFLISAPNADTAADNNAGAMYLVYGKAGGGIASATLESMVSSGSAAKVTGEAGSFLGTNVGMGDWNGDGIQDFAVGAWEANANQTGSLYSFAGSIAKLTQSFTVGNDTLTAGGSSTGAPSIVNGVDRLSGGLGDDVITGIGTDTTGTTATSTLHDVAYGGAGNDTISLAGLNLTRADGGQGTDTLKLAGSALDLDLATYGTRIHGFEKFDLGVGGAADANTLRLRLSDVLNEPESTATLGHLEIKGDSSDALYLTNGSTGTWASTGTTSANGDTYTVYHHSTMAAGNTLGDVWVQLGMQVNQV